jgi:membrane protein DedA with SNARE-associated domain
VPPFLQFFTDLPQWMIYLVVGGGAAIENFIPPVPADTFVLLGAFLSSAGRANLWLVFLVTWGSNVVAAAVVYRLAHRYGRGFFSTRAGHRLLNPRQLEQIGRFYDRFGVPAILVSRFLPAFRAAVPVFAGVSHVQFWRVFPPLALASAVWYGLLVYLGAFAGRNWEEIMHFFGEFSTLLLAVAGGLIVALAVWWWRSRRHHEP